MNEKIYLFKRAADGVWIFGPNVDCEHPAGVCLARPNSVKDKVTIIYVGRPYSNLDIDKKPVTDFLDEAGNAYADFEALKAGYAGFFVKALVGGGTTITDSVTLTDSVSGNKMKIIATDTGIDFYKSTDGGVTWELIGGFA